jgi:hypothetical protein
MNRKLGLIAALFGLLNMAAVQRGTSAEPSAQYATGSNSLDKAPIATIKISMLPVANISPLLYGVAYDWDVNPGQTFGQWQQAMQNVAHYKMAQFGGGWNAEHYEWGKNQCPPYCESNSCYDPTKQPAGVDPSVFVAMVPEAQFIIPDSPVVKEDDSEKRKTAVIGVTRTARSIVASYSHGIKPVRNFIIGNEWWIERGALNSSETTAKNLSRYAELLSSVVPAMKQVNPSIQIYALADWLNPEEYTQIRAQVGEAVWQQLDGVAIHAYLQTVSGEGKHKHVTSAQLVNQVDKVRRYSGKDVVFDPQWSLTPAPDGGKAPPAFGIQNANQLVLALQQMAFARIYGAMIWPAVGYVDEIDFFDAKYRNGEPFGGNFAFPHASGILFGWMSQYYEGQALSTSGDMPAAAALQNRMDTLQGSMHPQVTIIVPSLSQGLVRVQIPLAETPLRQAVSAEVMYSDNPGDKNLSRFVKVVTLPTFITSDPQGKPTLNFYLNPGGAKRGTSAEIARVTLR